MNILKQADMVVPDFDHTNCTQMKHQAQQRGFMRRMNWQRDNDIRGAVYGTQAHMRSEQNTRYEVPTQNRFAGLGDNLQGN